MGLRTFVYVQDEHGNSVGFGPGDVVPPWAAQQITNPKAWEDGAPVPVAEVDPDAPTVPVVALIQDKHGDPTEPPRGGPGSSRDAWATYATSIGVEVQPGTTKADIIAEVESARSAG